MNSDNCIKIKILYKLNKIKWSHLPTLTTDNKMLGSKNLGTKCIRTSICIVFANHD